MNGYEKALSLNLTGSPQEIVDKVKPLTANKINLAYLMELLNFRGMLRKTDGQNGQERWVGTLPNLKASLIALNQTDSVIAYEMWFSHVTNPRQINWDTTISEYAAPFAAMEAIFANQLGMPSSDDFAAVVALGGGRPYNNYTVEQFNIDKLSYENSERKKEIRTSFDEILNQIGTDEESQAKSALQNIVDSLEG
jgi:hypothetical protein